MPDRKKRAMVRRGHAEERRNPEDGSITRVVDEVGVDLPQESAFLLAVDSVKDERLKGVLIRSLNEAHAKRLALMDKLHERAEAREDRALEADIELRARNMSYGRWLFVMVFVGFMVAVLSGAAAECLWAFAIFFLGSAGLYALGQWGKKSPPGGGA